ncbi:MAG TPA: nucleotidyltransferase [Nitrospiraceae bacterium]|nr:nucleotidyltransferase [Nitrospiraceae bacterium]
MSEELAVLKTVTGQLAHAGVPYMVTGSIAANVYAVPRMTRDIDIVVELSERDVDRIVEQFQNEFYIDSEMVQRAVTEKGMFNMIHHAFVIKVDFVVRKDTEYRREEFSRRRSVSVEGQNFFIVAPEDLILSKLDWAKESLSETQLNDVRNLLNSVEGLDRHYLAHWSNRLGLASLYQQVTG